LSEAQPALKGIVSQLRDALADEEPVNGLSAL
jgi:hypothetical protein